MKLWTIVTHEESMGEATPFTARLEVRAGIPGPRDRFVAYSAGVERLSSVVVVGQMTGDGKTSHGSQLQAVSADDARALAKALLEAADEADAQRRAAAKSGGDHG